MLLVGVQTADEPFSQASFPQPPNLLVNGDKPRLRFFFSGAEASPAVPGRGCLPCPTQPSPARLGSARPRPSPHRPASLLLPSAVLGRVPGAPARPRLGGGDGAAPVPGARLLPSPRGNEPGPGLSAQVCPAFVSIRSAIGFWEGSRSFPP